MSSCISRGGSRFALVVAILGSAATAQTGAPQFRSSVKNIDVAVAGLRQPAEILIDRWGVPHIYAGNTHDAFFLQGYNAARDRLWQIDLWRKRGLGLLARDFGPSYVAQDRAARLFLYRGDMEREWKSYGPNAEAYAQAFTAGINAYVQGIRAGKLALPREFDIAQTRPDLWSPEDVVRIRSHGLIGNVEDEVSRAQVICAAGKQADAYRSKLEPAWTPQTPKGFDPCSVPSDVLRDYSLGTRSVTFRAGSATTDMAPEAARSNKDIAAIGSNNWVISGQRTATGRSILANDPHRGHSAPSLRYLVHLNAPGLSVIGAGEPALPGISIGHNGSIAFGLTIFSIDQEDLYQYALDASGTRYRYGPGYEPIRVLTETIEIKGEAPRRVELKFTRHGPLLKVDQRRRTGWALRSVWFQPGTSAYFGSSDYMTARNWDEFLVSMARWGTPGENQVFADTRGNIGWVAAGMTPRRTRWDGLMPVPGDGRYEWQGFLPAAELPRTLNPREGWFATANQMNLPKGYPINERRVAFEWADPSRYQRISEVLSSNRSGTLADSMALQNDVTSPVQQRFVKIVRGLELLSTASATERHALELVKAWDARVTRESPAASIAELWLNAHLPTATTAALYAKNATLIGRPATRSLLALLERPDARFGKSPAAGRDRILRESFAKTVSELASKLGQDPASWRYDRLHKARFVHSLSPLANQLDRSQLEVGPLSMEGAWSSPLASSFANGRLVAGASFRMVLDVGNWDASQAINTPGQSGDPWSPHYRDLAASWAHGRYFPLVYSRSAVEAQTTERLVLRPTATAPGGAEILAPTDQSQVQR